VELVGVQIHAAVGRGGQRRPLRVDAEEVEVGQARRHSSLNQKKFRARPRCKSEKYVPLGGWPFRGASRASPAR
jgi:hypothetical protein